jgi:hypothetical protein
MAVKQRKLGNNPLSQGIFTKTTSSPDEESNKKTLDSIFLNQDHPLTSQEIENQDASFKTLESQPPDEESSKKTLDSIFLNETEREKINLRIPTAINDWLDELLKKGKRKHGQKIAKEIWVQAALELFKAMPVQWMDIENKEALRKELRMLESRVKNQES